MRQNVTLILEGTLASFRTDREMQTDLTRLTKACCQPSYFRHLEGAPLRSRVVAETA